MIPHIIGFLIIMLINLRYNSTFNKLFNNNNSKKFIISAYKMLVSNSAFNKPFKHFAYNEL